jgi:hypothetical protein
MAQAVPLRERIAPGGRDPAPTRARDVSRVFRQEKSLEFEGGDDPADADLLQ